MRQKTFDRKLLVNKRTIADLEHREMGKIHGGKDNVSDASNCVSICFPACPVTDVGISCPCGGTG